MGFLLLSYKSEVAHGKIMPEIHEGDDRNAQLESW